MASIEPSKLDRMKRSFGSDAALDQVFIVLSIGAGLIATGATPVDVDRGARQLRVLLNLERGAATGR